MAISRMPSCLSDLHHRFSLTFPLHHYRHLEMDPASAMPCEALMPPSLEHMPPHQNLVGVLPTTL